MAKRGMYIDKSGKPVTFTDIPKAIPKPAPQTPKTPIIVPPELNIQDRQELANARATNAGIEPINLRTQETQTQTTARLAQTAKDQQAQENINAAKASGLLDMAQNLGANPYEGTAALGTPGTEPNYAESLSAGLVQAGQGALLGAAGGSVLPGLGTFVGAVGGALTGFIRGEINSMKKQQNENIAASYSNLPTSAKNLRMIIQDTNQGGDATSNWALFQEQLDVIDEARGQLKRESRGVKKLITGEDAKVELEKMENFYAVGGARDYLINEMQQAILNPNPAKSLVTMDDFTE